MQANYKCSNYKTMEAQERIPSSHLFDLSQAYI